MTTTRLVMLSLAAITMSSTRRLCASYTLQSSFTRSLSLPIKQHGALQQHQARHQQHHQQRRGYSQTSSLSMKLQTAIVGLPNVGKSTLFNALTETQGAEAANYPFCTIEPNVGIVEVPDEKLPVLSEINSSVKVVPTTLEFVDVAGLVKGASSGEGLGNQFLATIRQCDAVVHVVRCFEDENVIHVDGSVDPVRDAELINLELAISDLAQVEKRLERIKKDLKTGKASEAEATALEKIAVVLNRDEPARNAVLDEAEEEAIKSFGLLTKKKMIYAANVDDADLAEGNAMVDKLKELAEKEGAKVALVSAQVEAELVDLEADDKIEFLEALGVTIENCGLRSLVREVYDILQLQTYYTSGPTETRAWTIKRGWTAPQAAGVIHGDFERGFIKAETVAYKDLVEYGSEAEAKKNGVLRQEGKEYVVQEGDVILFKFNV